MLKKILVTLILLPQLVLAAAWQDLHDFGFDTKEKKQALVTIMQTAGIADAKNVLKTNDICDFVTITQQYFNLRKDRKERWQITIPEWMKDPSNQQKVIKALQNLNMLSAVPSKFPQHDAIVVLGATKQTMELRLDYAATLLPAKQLILLTGERYVTPDFDGIYLDGSKTELEALAKELHKKYAQLTETDVFVAAYKTCPLYNKLPLTVIDTPKADLPRPTTATTVEALVKWLQKHPEVQSVTFVSNQPHVTYQEAVISRVLMQQKVAIKFEVVGPAYDVDNKDPVHTLVEGVGALGAQIYAMSTCVLD